MLSETLPMAFYVGVSAPLVFDRLAAGIQPFDRAITGNDKNGGR
jgi:hypothetical protein